VQDLETQVTEAADDMRTNVDNESTDFGARWEAEREAGSAELRYGIDAFGRSNVDATETATSRSTGERITRDQTLDDGAETELGGFASARWERGRTRWEVGSRYTWGEQSNSGFSDRQRNGWSGFAGVAHSFGLRFELRGGVSTGLRFPSLTEQFFTGTTGRGIAIGNPDLDDERSFDVETSLRWIGRRVVWTGVVFRSEIDDYIERVDLAPDLRTWVNLSSGTLADTPPNELYLGATRHAGPWTTEARLRLRDDRSDPGPGELPISSAQLLAASVRYRWSSGWEMGFGGTNLLDEDYLPSADDKAVPGAGRAFTAHVTRRR
jgi:iron complex outermembrane receptor protein